MIKLAIDNYKSSYSKNINSGDIISFELNGKPFEAVFTFSFTENNNNSILLKFSSKQEFADFYSTLDQIQDTIPEKVNFDDNFSKSFKEKFGNDPNTEGWQYLIENSYIKNIKKISPILKNIDFSTLKKGDRVVAAFQHKSMTHFIYEEVIVDFNYPSANLIYCKSPHIIDNLRGICYRNNNSPKKDLTILNGYNDSFIIKKLDNLENKQIQSEIKKKPTMKKTTFTYKKDGKHYSIGDIINIHKNGVDYGDATIVGYSKTHNVFIIKTTEKRKIGGKYTTNEYSARRRPYSYYDYYNRYLPANTIRSEYKKDKNSPLFMSISTNGTQFELKKISSEPLIENNTTNNTTQPSFISVQEAIVNLTKEMEGITNIVNDIQMSDANIKQNYINNLQHSFQYISSKDIEYLNDIMNNKYVNFNTEILLMQCKYLTSSIRLKEPYQDIDDKIFTSLVADYTASFKEAYINNIVNFPLTEEEIRNNINGFTTYVSGYLNAQTDKRASHSSIDKKLSLKNELTKAMYRSATDQGISVLKKTVSTALNDHDKNTAIMSILQSQMGEAILRSSLGYIAANTISNKNNHLDIIAEELRISGLTCAGNFIVDLAKDFLQPALLSLMEEKPIEKSSNIRIKTKKKKISQIDDEENMIEISKEKQLN